MRVLFSSMGAARAAVSVLEAYGYSAKQLGREVVTDCPTLLAVPAIQKGVGLANVDHIDLMTGRGTAEGQGDPAVPGRSRQTGESTQIEVPAQLALAPAFSLAVPRSSWCSSAFETSPREDLKRFDETAGLPAPPIG
jgi:hypothetical protein